VYERLEAGEGEAVSHALNSCRRLIKAVADSLFPPETDRVVNGQTIKLGDGEVLNRLEMFISERTPSGSRRQRLRRTLADLYDRTSAGVHSDVSADEAKHVFLQTYAVLGEIILLDPADSQ
jgi:hypothetical protein